MFAFKSKLIHWKLQVHNINLDIFWDLFKNFALLAIIFVQMNQVRVYSNTYIIAFFK